MNKIIIALLIVATIAVASLLTYQGYYIQYDAQNIEGIEPLCMSRNREYVVAENGIDIIVVCLDDVSSENAN